MNTRSESTPERITQPKLHASRCPPLATRQRGIALLALLGLLMLVGAGLLIKQLNARGKSNPQLSSRTGVALKQAKSALIARAVMDPNRPGELPCPDTNYDGVTSLANPCTSLLGWLPWRTLDLPELRDASGARLWYGLSDNWRAGNSLPLNPDTHGGLTLNGAGNPDIVAMIIAPGTDVRPPKVQVAEPRPKATSLTMDATNQSLVKKFLEDANSNTDLTAYVSQPPAEDFNDRLVTITRAELIAAVQRRVAGELAVALSDYRAKNGRYPWLSDNPDPLAVNPPELDGVPGVRNGHIAYLEALTPDDFTSGFTVRWYRNTDKVPDDKSESTKLDIDTSATAWGTPGTDPMIDAVRGALDAIGIDPVPDPIELYVPDNDKDKMKDGVKNALKNDSQENPQTVVWPTTALSGATCIGHNDYSWVDCEYDAKTPAPYGSVDLCVKGNGFDECPSKLAGINVKRTVFLNLHYLGTSAIGVTNGARTRDVQSPNGSFQSSPTGTTMIRFTDRLDSPFTDFFATRALIPADGDDADFNTTDIYAEPQSGGMLPGDLPAWFAANNWGPYLYVNYAANFIPTGTGACMVDFDCLKLSVMDVISRTDIEAVVVGAGVALSTTPTPQTRGAGSTLADLFEVDNQTNNDNVARNPAPPAVFNDYVRLVACATGPAVDCR